MNLGTPLQPGATRVLLLGSGELGKELVIALQRYGVEVMAADRYPNAPAMQLAHHAVVLDMTDAAALNTLITQFKPDYIVPEIEAIATDVLAEFEVTGNTVVVPNARAVKLTMDREGIRRLAAETLHLPTSAYAFASSREALFLAVTEVGTPCFVKPVMSSSGKGQSRLDCADQANIDAAWAHAQEGGRVRQARVIVESLIPFDFEITVLTVRSLGPDGRLQTTCCDPVGHLQQHGDYVESWQPQAMTALAWSRAQAIACTVVEALGGQGLFGVELFVCGDEIWFSEVSPRPHDTGMVTQVSQAQSEFELHARALLGLPVQTTLRRAGASAVIYGELDAGALRYTGLEQALAVPETEVRLFGKPESFARRRMGVALACADDVDEARARARKAAALIRTERMPLVPKP